jgi:ABC-2 type transport system ATP-binding protein
VFARGRRGLTDRQRPAPARGTIGIVLHFESASLRYRDTLAVDALTLTCHAGEVLGLLGPNGAGKSTTFAMASGLLAPSGGRVRIDVDRSPAEARREGLIGAAPQALAIYPELTGTENLVFFASLFGMRRRDAKRRAAELLERVGLAQHAAKRAGRYSGGMARRLNLAAAVMHDPRIVLLDEPTAGVDPHSRAAILDLVRDLAASGAAVLYTTHLIDEAQRLCDRVAVMDRGRVLALGDVESLINSHGERPVVVVETKTGIERVDADDPATAVSALLGRSDVRGVRIDRPDLETVFLDLTGRSLRDA